MEGGGRAYPLPYKSHVLMQLWYRGGRCLLVVTQDAQGISSLITTKATGFCLLREIIAPKTWFDLGGYRPPQIHYWVRAPLSGSASRSSTNPDAPGDRRHIYIYTRSWLGQYTRSSTYIKNRCVVDTWRVRGGYVPSSDHQSHSRHLHIIYE